MFRISYAVYSRAQRASTDSRDVLTAIAVFSVQVELGLLWMLAVLPALI